MVSWNTRVSDVAQELLKDGAMNRIFPSGIAAAFLEGSGPSIASVITQMKEVSLSDHVLVFPLFLTASSHLSEDIPTVLGLSQDEVKISELKAEGIDVLPKDFIDIEIAPPIAASDFLPKNIARRALKFSENPRQESIVLAYYGSERYADAWNGLIQDITNELTGRGFMHVGSAAMGHVVKGSDEPLLSAINSALSVSVSVILVPVLVSYGYFQPIFIPRALNKLREKERVRFTDDSILPDEDLVAWIKRVCVSINE